MAKDSLEERANSVNSDTENNLEDIVKNHKHKGFFGKLFDYTIAAASVFASYALIGPVALLANGVAFVSDRIVNLKRKRDTPSRQTRNSAILASLMSVPGKIGFDIMNSLINVKTWGGWLTRAAVQLGIFQPLMITTYNTFSYPLINKTFKGMYEKGYKQLPWKMYKDHLKYLGIPNMLAARFLPAATHFPIYLGLRTAYRTMIGERIMEIYEDPYRYEHKRIDGQSITDLIKKYQAKQEHKPPAYQPAYQPA